MKSKTSFFNGTLFFHWLRRFWPLMLAVLAVVLFQPGVRLAGILQEQDSVDKLINCRSAIYGTGQMMAALMAGAAMLASALVFHHLHSLREIQFYHGLPVTRTGLFVTGYLSGFCLIAIPMSLGLLLEAAMLAAVGGGGAAPALIRLLGAGLAVELICYSMAVLACVLAGHTLGAVLIYLGMHFAVYVIAAGINYAGGLVMPGVALDMGPMEDVVRWLTPLSNLMIALLPAWEQIPAAEISIADGAMAAAIGPGGQEFFLLATGFSEPWVLIACAVVGLLLFALALGLYRVRRAETAGDMISFGPVRGICQVFGALAVSAAGTLLITETGLFREDIPFWAVTLVVLGFAALGYLIAEGIVQKTFRVFRRKTMLRGGILLLVLVIALGVGKTDLFGRVRYVPAPEKIDYVSVQYQNGLAVELPPEDAAALQREVLAHRELLTNNPGRYLGSTDLNFFYRLRNGHTMYRKYRIETTLNEDYTFAENALSETVRELLSRPENCIQTYFPSGQGELQENTFQYGAYHRYVWSEEAEQADLELTAGEAIALYQAFLRDVEAGRVAPNGMPTESGVLGNLEFAWYGEPYDGSKYASYQEYEKTVREQHAHVDVTERMTETLACLERIADSR